MIKVKNTHTGIIVIGDAGLRLEPGETALIEEETPFVKKAKAAGLLIAEKSDGKKDEAFAEEAEETDLSGLSVGEAINRVSGEESREALELFLENEERRSVTDAIRARLAELPGAELTERLPDEEDEDGAGDAD